MEPTSPSKDDKIAIIGASVLGLSAALHLAARGYKDITIFDKRSQSDLTATLTQGSPYAAVRCSPADQPGYRDLSVEAVTGWEDWNRELWGGKTVPPGMRPEDRVFINNGFFSLFDGGDAIPESELARVKAMEQKGMELALLLSMNLDHVDSANSRMFNIDPFRREEKSKANLGVMDTLGGTVIIGKAYQFALHKAQTQGVKFAMDSEEGAVKEVVYQDQGENEWKDVKGVRTRDGKTHDVDFVVWACQPATSIPYNPAYSDTTVSNSTELTAAARLPEGADIWDHLAPDNFPSWEYNLSKHKGMIISGFPRDDDGWMVVKIGATAEPSIAKNDVVMDRIKNFLADFLPELKEAGVDIRELPIISPGKIYPENCIIDRVPGVKNLILAADGRKFIEGFMFLPNIGSHTVDILEGGKPTFTAWQCKSNSTRDPPINQGAKRLRKAKL